ncbi:MAG: hypothetical protein AAFY57_02785 [Cyanobacteria bacterium J06642_2]
MSLLAESFELYVERRRQQATVELQQQRRWTFLVCLLAVYLWPFYLLGLLALPAPVSALSVTLAGVALYMLGTYLLTVSRDRWRDLGQWWPFIYQSISGPHVAIAAVIWLSVALWGEAVAPLLSRQIPQVMAGVGLSLCVTGGHYWLTFRTWWTAEMSQLWGDYLHEVQLALVPYYGQLDRARQRFSQFDTLCDDLMLEEVEALHLARDFSDRVQWVTDSGEWVDYVDRVNHSRQHLAQLLHQLEDSIATLESVLSELETHLDYQWEAARVGPELALLSRALGQPVFELSRDLVIVEQTIAGVSARMDSFAATNWHAP